MVTEKEDKEELEAAGFKDREKTPEITTKEVEIPETWVTTQAFPQENEREITVSFKFNPSKIDKEELDLIATRVLGDAKGKVLSALKTIIVQEERLLDRTRQ